VRGSLVSVSSLGLESSLVLDNLVQVLVHVSNVCCRSTPLIPTVRLLRAVLLACWREPGREIHTSTHTSLGPFRVARSAQVLQFNVA